MKKIWFFILALGLVFSPSLIKADYSNTIDYLQSQTQNAWITQALASANVDNPDISYIDAQTTDLMTAIKNVLVLTAIESDNQADLLSLSNTIDSNMSGGQLGSADLLNDDFWGLMALKSIDQTDNISDIKEFILSQQNPDGGWSWSTTGESDTNDTSAALMALLDAGLSASSTEIVDALGYLATAQNDDGGFGYDVLGDSDGASTAWVITALNKASVDSSSWQKGDNNPILFLQSLETENGSFLWLASDEVGSGMVTAYALVALNNKSYPVNYISLPDDEPELTGHTLRIEGPGSTICLASNLEANTPLDLLEAGSQVCNFEYIAENTEYGLYVSSIGGVDAAGMEGWQYWIDWQPGMVAADEAQLTEGQDVLWGYGGFPLYPAKTELSAESVELGENFTATAKYFDGDNWQVYSGATIEINNQSYTTDQNGQLQISLDQNGIYPIYTKQADGFVSSNKVYLQVGDGISQTVDLTVNILNSGGGNDDDEIAFSVSQSNIDFGDLRAGQSTETILTLNNTGNAEVYIEASILGDDIFVDYTNLDNATWEDFNTLIGQNSDSSVNIQLALPNELSTSGQKDGQLIFWATNNQ